MADVQKDYEFMAEYIGDSKPYKKDGVYSGYYISSRCLNIVYDNDRPVKKYQCLSVEQAKRQFDATVREIKRVLIECSQE